MLYKYFYTALISLLFIGQSLFAELLIAKRYQGKIIPLTDVDIQKHGSKINEILQKYQWPMCTASDISDAEKSELFSSGNPCAEEQFIQQKLHEVIDKQECDVQVVFVPTTLYELYLVQYFFVHLDSVLYKVLDQYRESLNLEKVLNNQDLDSHHIWKKTFQEYGVINYRFISDKQSALLEFNQSLFLKLFSINPELQNSCDALSGSEVIKRHAKAIAKKFIQENIDLYKTNKTYYFCKYDSREKNLYRNQTINLMIDSFRLHYFIFDQYIDHEYEARDQNRALLIRGTSPVKIKTNSEEYTLLGTTLRRYDEDPYSISFGGSLLGGFIRDIGACPYYFLTGRKVAEDNRPTKLTNGIAGYSLFVDKQRYMKDRESNLFFIPPLSIIASLFSNGEYFHPRTVSVVDKKINESIPVKGVFGSKLQDPAGVILIERDPLYQAELFSEFIVKNGKIIQRRDESEGSEEDQKIAQNILIAHKKAAQDYKKMRTNLKKTFQNKSD